MVPKLSEEVLVGVFIGVGVWVGNLEGGAE